jgi:hypothetical protein
MEIIPAIGNIKHKESSNESVIEIRNINYSSGFL